MLHNRYTNPPRTALAYVKHTDMAHAHFFVCHPEVELRNQNLTSSNKIDVLNTHGLEAVAVRRSGYHIGDGGKGSEAQEEDEPEPHGLWWFLGDNIPLSCLRLQMWIQVFQSLT